ncbi:MAG: DUF3769 domain-containing protein [Symploca sp. SIO2E9]|nr:DUF3769 domain-containing protein [Symploca sp. SIO2E9]
MLQPVQPPEVPQIVQFVNPEDRASEDKFLPEALFSLKTRNVATQEKPVPNPPENLVLESSLSKIETQSYVSLDSSQQQQEQGKQVSSKSSPEIKVSPPTREGEGRRQEEQLRSNNLQGDLTPSTVVDHSAVNLGPALSINDPQQKEVPVTIVKRLLVQERGGEVREFEFSVPSSDTPYPSAQGNQQSQSPQGQDSNNRETNIPIEAGSVIELSADRQEYDAQRQIITAEGNVILRFQDALLDADRLQVNLPNRIIVAEGNVALTRRGQVLRGERFEYYFVSDSGLILNASGELQTESRTQATAGPSSDRLVREQPLQGVTSLGGYSFEVGASFASEDDQSTLPSIQSPETEGTLNRFRYQAERIEFEGAEAVATNVRITNDPFSPPELELRANSARFRRISPEVDEVVASKPRLVFDQGFSLPILRNRVIIDRRQRQPALFNLGFDNDERGGLFVERTFGVINTPKLELSITPQYFVQRAIFGDDDNEGGIVNPSAFGGKAQLEATFNPRTNLVGRANLTSLEPDDFDDELRASLRLRHVIGNRLPHTLNLEYSYRDRLFNGSLGFQTVQSSIGSVITSSPTPLGKTGISLRYQAGVQNINARTDRDELLEVDRDNDRISLTRYQASASLNRGFLLWRGKTLPATPTEGLRYTSRPILPNLRLSTSLTGVASAYSNGDNQQSLSGTIRLTGQLGHFSRPFLDYTGFNLSYTQVTRGSESPFRFDRIADRSILSGGITQQVYGPFRMGFQTAFNLDSGEEISTDYFIEYSRRTYNILLRYNPVQDRGSIGFRINDFNWRGNPGLFDGSGVRPVVQGVTR